MIGQWTYHGMETIIDRSERSSESEDLVETECDGNKIIFLFSEWINHAILRAKSLRLNYINAIKRLFACPSARASCLGVANRLILSIIQVEARCCETLISYPGRSDLLTRYRMFWWAWIQIEIFEKSKKKNILNATLTVKKL